MQEKSEVEQYWDKIAKSQNDERTWDELPLQHQLAVCESLNLIFAILANKDKR